MSFVTLIVIKNKQLRMLSAHYRIIKKLIDYGDFEFDIIKNAVTTFVDAGYILVDCDTNIMINAQDAFAPNINGFQEIII